MYIGLSTPEDYLRVIKNHKWMIVLPILLSISLAWGVYQWLPKTYKSSALLHFEGQKVRFVKGVDESGADSEKPEVALSSRILMMKEALYKRDFLTGVAQELHLYGYEKENATTAVDDNVAARMRTSVQFDSKEAPFLKVSFSDPDPVVARDVMARLADRFIKEYAQSREVIATSSTEFFQDELEMLKGQLETKEHALAQFKKAHLGQLPEQMDSNLRAIERLENEAAGQLEMEKTLNLRLESVEKAIREYEDPTSETSPRRAAKDPRLAKIKELERSLAGLQSMYKETYPDVARVRNEIKQLHAMTTEDYIALYVEQEPAEVEGGKKGKRKLTDPYKAELLKQREDVMHEMELVHHRKDRIAENLNKYQARVDGTAVHQQEFLTIQRDYDNLQRNYQTLLEKKITIGIAGNLEKKRQGTLIRIIEPPKVPGWPEKPNVFIIMFGGLAIGCALGFGTAFGLEIMRRGFVSAEEIEIVLGLQVLAAISQFESAWPGSRETSTAQSRRWQPLLSLPGLNKEGLFVTNRTADIAVSPELVAMWYPRSVVAEQYRVAATRVSLVAGKKKSIVVVVTSALMGEGKTSTALNMAHVLSQDLNRKTVLVDCDLKRPMVHTYAGIESTAGLTEVLLGKKLLDECLEYHEQLGIWIVPAGIEQSGTAALAHVDRLSELIQDLRDKFEYIVLDAPPLLPVAESMLIVRMADVVAHVIRARTTPRDIVTTAIKMIGEERPVAVVLNGVEAKDEPYSSYYSYGRGIYEPHHKQLR